MLTRHELYERVRHKPPSARINSTDGLIALPEIRVESAAMKSKPPRNSPAPWCKAQPPIIDIWRRWDEHHKHIT